MPTTRAHHSSAKRAKPVQRRPVTSCLECYRRKQRCNRRQPCNHCCFRKVPEKCIFSTNPIPLDSSFSHQHTNVSYTDNIVEESSFRGTIPASSNVVDQADSSTSWSNTSLDQTPRIEAQQTNSVDETTTQSSASPTRQSGLVHSYTELLSYLPPIDTVKKLLDYFFHDLYWGAMAIDKNHFQNLHDCWRAIPISNHFEGCDDLYAQEMRCFPALIFQMLAQALHAISPQHTAAIDLGLRDSSACDRQSEAFHIKGNEIVHLLGRHNPTVCSIEHDVLAFCWLKNAGRLSEAWWQLGGAIRYSALYRQKFSNLHLYADKLKS